MSGRPCAINKLLFLNDTAVTSFRVHGDKKSHIYWRKFLLYGWFNIPLIFQDHSNQLNWPLLKSSSSQYLSSRFSWWCPLTGQDGNGYIDRRELAVMLRSLGMTMTEEEITEIIDQADVDRDGLIDYGEFYNMMSSWRISDEFTYIHHNQHYYVLSQILSSSL